MCWDHVELLVPDRDAAAAWYDRWLGFRVMPEHIDWAANGPLMLTNDGGVTMLALFQGASPEPSAKPAAAGWRRVAFRATGGDFLTFVARFRSSGQAIVGPQDHGKAWSVYFTDPWGHKLEVTTYDYAVVANALQA
jgi:catechol 2,3-dioxygenase-like lactoylglutathione lyase family enzyme